MAVKKEPKTKKEDKTAVAATAPAAAAPAAAAPVQEKAAAKPPPAVAADAKASAPAPSVAPAAAKASAPVQPSAASPPEVRKMEVKEKEEEEVNLIQEEATMRSKEGSFSACTL